MRSGRHTGISGYAALIDGKGGAYGVMFPDLPGCTAMGTTIDEAMANAACAVRDWLEFSSPSQPTVAKPRRTQSFKARQG